MCQEYSTHHLERGMHCPAKTTPINRETNVERSKKPDGERAWTCPFPRRFVCRPQPVNISCNQRTQRRLTVRPVQRTIGECAAVR